MQVQYLPPVLSEEDEAAVRRGREMLAELHREYTARAEPIRRGMAEIVAKYPSRYIITGDTT